MEINNGIRNLMLACALALCLVVASPSEVLANGYQTAKVSWYGSAFYGKKTANGTTYNGTMLSFAHRSMRFGTVVEFVYRGRKVKAVCNDRGPFVHGRTFDLSAGTARTLGFRGVGIVKWRVVNGSFSQHKPKRIKRKRTARDERIALLSRIRLDGKQYTRGSYHRYRQSHRRMGNIEKRIVFLDRATSQEDARVAQVDR